MVLHRSSKYPCGKTPARVRSVQDTDRLNSIFDLYMKSLCNGKEREAQDWKSLIAASDSRFHIRALSQVPTSKLGIIDVEWMG